MSSIEQAKKDFSEKYRDVDGFIGIGIGQIGDTKCLRIYLSSTDCELARILMYENDFNEFKFTTHVTGKMTAL